MKINKLLLAISFGIALSSTVPLTAEASGYCAPSVGVALSDNTLKAEKRVKADVEQLSTNDADQLDAANDTFSCSDVWSNPSISVSFQNVVDLLKKAGEAAVSKACNAAREKISSATEAASQKASLDTSNIPGLSDLGLGTIASVSSGTSSSSDAITVNGNSTTWSSLGSLLN